MNRQVIYEWIASELAGQINPASEQSLANWRKESIENEKEYQECMASWNAAGPKERIKYPEVVSEWKLLEKKIDKKQRILQFDRSKDQHFSRRMWLSAAAMILFFVLSGTAWHFIFSPVNLTTSAGMRSTWTLPDGSSVALNAGSRLTYSRQFGSALRRVRLEGEGYFSVKPSEVPFIVETENAIVRVLGTRFHVRSRNSRTRLIVTEGKVAFKQQDSDSEAQVLYAGQLSVCRSDREPGLISQVEVEEVVGWMDGRLIFLSTPLSEILDEISRVFDISVRLSTGINGSSLLTFIYYENSAESVLQAIATVMQLELTVKNDVFVLQ
ncbi:FecR domain-containing protein [bacterium]|nr:FecR domain-containing protein [bacterium]